MTNVTTKSPVKCRSAYRTNDDYATALEAANKQGDLRRYLARKGPEAFKLPRFKEQAAKLAKPSKKAAPTAPIPRASLFEKPVPFEKQLEGLSTVQLAGVHRVMQEEVARTRKRTAPASLMAFDNARARVAVVNRELRKTFN